MFRASLIPSLHCQLFLHAAKEKQFSTCKTKLAVETGNEAISEPHNTVDMAIQKCECPDFMELMTS